MGKEKENGSMKLFDDDSNGLDDDVSKIEINQEFARRYEHNKKREDLQRIQELEKKGVVNFTDNDSEESSSEKEEEDMQKPSNKRDLEFFDALIKVKRQDPLLNSKDAKLFFSDSESMSEDENDNKSENQKLDNNNDGRKGKKPMYLKDVVSKHLIDEGPEFDDEDEDEDVNNRKSDGNAKVKSFAEEQEELRREFLKEFEEAANVEDEEGDFLREKNGDGKQEEKDDGEIGKKLDDYFGEDEKLDEDTKFLKDYFRNKMWLDDGKIINSVDEDVGFSEDEEEIEKQEDFERGYNFRFEENAGDRVMGHSRKVEGSVRKEENARKLQRERKEERKMQAEFEQNEELKHLKNLKKKEIKEKLQKIREAAGIGEDGTCLLDKDDLEEEFDPEDYDRKIKEAFDNKYYDMEDVNPEFGSDSNDDAAEYEKPDFDEEDRLLGFPNGWNEKDTGDGFLSARQRILKSKLDGKDESELVEDEENPKEGKWKRKRKPSEVENAVRKQLMEEYYKLDYEDTIGDLKTRFKYKPVKSKRFGLSTEEILNLDDKELNQYVSLKKLAPYREKEWKVPRIKTYQQKLRNKALLEGETSNTNNKVNNKTQLNGLEKPKVVSVAENEKSQMEESNGDTTNLSRRSKRRRRQAELKLSRSRLMAYGKIHSKSKSKMH